MILSMISNQTLPGGDTSDHLDTLDKARLLETLHLKSELGGQVWPGFNDANFPIIIWNEAYEFLVNYDGRTPSGWTKITDDDLNRQYYFKRSANDPQNFAVRVGDAWSASMATKQTTDVFMVRTFHDILPSPIKQIFPYRLILQPSETQMGAVLHEAFHVYQYQTTPIRMDKAESIHQLGDHYETTSEQFKSEWKSESALLADALEAETLQEKTGLVRQFLSERDARRSDYRMSVELIDYEKWLEWEEGTAKYIEVAFQKAASESAVYQPLPEMNNDPDFKAYQKYDQRWSQELIQLRYQTTSGESQFYMTGMAQAFLLDELMPDWKDEYWSEDIFLEDLLRTAVTQ